MSRQTANNLTQQFEESEHYTENIGHGGCPQKGPQEHMLTFLCYAGNKSCIREVSERFCAGVSTMHKMMEKVLDFLCDLAPEVIKFPDDMERLAEDFQEVSGFPGVVGCIDATYINIRCPIKHAPSTFVNKSGPGLLTLQAVCDGSHRFLDIFTGPQGKVHDAHIFRSSSLPDRLPGLCRDDQYHVLGDEAYPLSVNLITPYQNSEMSDPDRESQEEFNKRHRAIHAVSVEAFGLLRQRFKQLTRLEFLTLDKLTRFVVSCCVLHNICIDAGDAIVDDDEASGNAQVLGMSPDPDADTLTALCESEIRQLGEQKRNRLRRIVVGS